MSLRGHIRIIKNGFIAFFFSLFFSIKGVQPAQAQTANQPNIVLIVGDDMGVDLINSYGYPSAPPTPNIDVLANRGVKFLDAAANPVSSPTRAAVLTGKYAFRLGIGRAIKYSTDNISLSLDETTLPEVLKDMGYTTLAFGKWHLSSAVNGGPNHPRMTGFDHHSGSMFNFTNQANPAETYYQWEKHIDGQPVMVNVYATTDTTNDVVAALQNLQGHQPFFL
jgi:arylsulfatase A-like enzyme